MSGFFRTSVQDAGGYIACVLTMIHSHLAPCTGACAPEHTEFTDPLSQPCKVSLYKAAPRCSALSAFSLWLVAAEDTQFIPNPLPTTEVIYFRNSLDSRGAQLDASTGTNYTLTFQLPIPYGAGSFWSLIIYNSDSLNVNTPGGAPAGVRS